MAVRKPLVLVGGEIQQLQSGDTLSGPVAEVDLVSLTNDDVGAHALGDVVYLDVADGAKKAKADAAGTSKAIAFATAAISAAASGSYQTNGILSGSDRSNRRGDLLPERGDSRRNDSHGAERDRAIRR
jgi:hypothetical protein